MSSLGHTAGSLIVERHDQDDGSVVYEIWTSNLRKRLARISDADNPRAKHDAQLFAAAPDQHSALMNAPRPLVRMEGEALSVWLVEYIDWFFKVRSAAINRATGTTP